MTDKRSDIAVADKKWQSRFSFPRQFNKYKREIATSIAPRDDRRGKRRRLSVFWGNRGDLSPL